MNPFRRRKDAKPQPAAPQPQTPASDQAARDLETCRAIAHAGTANRKNTRGERP